MDGEDREGQGAEARGEQEGWRSPGGKLGGGREAGDRSFLRHEGRGEHAGGPDGPQGKPRVLEPL